MGAGKFCHIILELCPGESQLTHGMDSGFGDFYRIAATTELQDLKAKPDDPSYTYKGMKSPTGARSYSPVTPLNENTVQLTLKEVVGRGSDYDCTNGVDCEYGMTELACMAPIGSDFLLSKRPDQQGKQGTHMAYVPNFSREPGSGPYTVNVIGQGVALTELNILVQSELLHPFSEDGSFSTIKEVNYLWANSYWANSRWMWDPTTSTDLSRKMLNIAGSYGIRFNLMYSISRQERPEAEWPRVDVNVIGDAFKLTNTTNQDPNIKWFIVGSSSYKKSVYPQIVEWGFDMQPCPGAESKGYPYCGPNALYGQLPPGEDPNSRERSDLFKYYEAQPTEAGVTNVDVTLKFDAYPMDISWALFNTCDGTKELAKGGDYGRSEFNEAITNSLSTPEGEFLLQIYDSYGDGLCCAYGTGNFFIDVNGDEIYRSKMEGPTEIESVKFKSPNGCGGVPEPTPEPTPEPADRVPVAITIFFDQFPEDTSWELFNTCIGPASVMIAEGRGYGQSDAKKDVTVFDEHVDDGTFLFVIKDVFGDGLCCTYGEGGYSIVYNKGTPIISKFEMVDHEATPFGREESCTYTPSDDDVARYSPDFGVPYCDKPSWGVCTTAGTGLLNKKTISGEPNGPNTLGGAEVCKDGRGGEYMVDESSEAITITSQDGGITPGGLINVTSHAFIFGNPLVEDVVDFWHTEDIYSDDPKWNYIATVTPLEPGFTDVESPVFVIGDSPLQAVRVVVRWAAGGMPDADEACPSWGEFNDIDDLIFTVAAGPEGRKLGVPAASIRGATAKMAPPMAFPGVAECSGYKKGRCDAAASCEWKGNYCV